jgi:hypothetical protein
MTLLSTCEKLDLGGSEKEPSSGNYLGKVLDIFNFMWNKVFGSGVTRVSRLWLLWSMVGRSWTLSSVCPSKALWFRYVYLPLIFCFFRIISSN